MPFAPHGTGLTAQWIEKSAARFSTGAISTSGVDITEAEAREVAFRGERSRKFRACPPRSECDRARLESRSLRGASRLWSKCDRQRAGFRPCRNAQAHFQSRPTLPESP